MIGCFYSQVLRLNKPRLKSGGPNKLGPNRFDPRIRFGSGQELRDKTFIMRLGNRGNLPKQSSLSFLV